MIKLKVKYLSERQKYVPNSYVIFFDFFPNKEYELVSIEENGWYRIIDESGEDYLYPPQKFEVVENEIDFDTAGSVAV